MNVLVEKLGALALPWADLYGGSAVLQGGVTFVHFAGLLTAGGLALSADAAVRRRSRAGWPERMALLPDLASTHHIVIAGLTAVVASGFLLLAADVEALLPSPVFWLKMAAFALLLANGLVLQRAERAVAVIRPEVATEGPADTGVAAPPAWPEDGERKWRALHRAALRSAGLWFAVLLLGTLLTAAA